MLAQVIRRYGVHFALTAKLFISAASLVPLVSIPLDTSTANACVWKEGRGEYVYFTESSPPSFVRRSLLRDFISWAFDWGLFSQPLTVAQKPDKS